MKRIQDKITELSKKPSTNADTIAVLRMCQKRIEQLEQENRQALVCIDDLARDKISVEYELRAYKESESALAAQVEWLKKIAYIADGARIEWADGNKGNETEWLNHLYREVGEYDERQTPAQCLAEVRAQAVEGAANHAIKIGGAGGLVEYDDLIEYANQLRRSAEGEI